MEVIQNKKTADPKVAQFLGMNISSQRRYIYKKENYQEPVMGHIVKTKYLYFFNMCIELLQ